MPSNVATFLSFLLATSGTPADVPTVPDAELTIGGIALGAEESTVVRTLGRPTRITDTGDFLSIRLEYPGLTIWLGEGGRVGEILSTNPQHCTPGGICPGAPFSQVQAQHGPPLVAAREDGEFMEYMPESDTSCWLQLSVANGVVKSVRAECQP